jgi:ornithine carbamoyltransferase
MTEPHHILDVGDLSPAELERVLDVAAAMKAEEESEPRLPRASMALLFEKPSTRTRVSFETAMTDLGGDAVFLGPDDTQLDRGEPIRDTARTLAGYTDVVAARLFSHADLEELAAYSSVPVVNALTDRAHPCQTLADLLTIRETLGGFDGRVAWVGDGNNVAQSFVVGCALVGLDLVVATPPGYGIDEAVLDRAADLGGRPEITTDPEAAVAGADAVYTDVWVSMGQEERRAEKLAAFDGFQVNADLLGDGDARVLHCLPAHRGEEITEAVLESDRALVWRQAENRLHAQKGLLVELLG